MYTVSPSRARAGVAIEEPLLTTAQGALAGVPGLVLLEAYTVLPSTHITPRESPRFSSWGAVPLLKAVVAPELVLRALGVLQSRGLLLLGSQLDNERVPALFTKLR